MCNEFNLTLIQHTSAFCVYVCVILCMCMCVCCVLTQYTQINTKLELLEKSSRYVKI